MTCFHSVAVDGSGDVFVVGNTSSTSNFPLPDPPDGGAYYDNTHNGDFGRIYSQVFGRHSEAGVEYLLWGE
jgi:hypothetical protein